MEDMRTVRDEYEQIGRSGSFKKAPNVEKKRSLISSFVYICIFICGCCLLATWILHFTRPKHEEILLKLMSDKIENINCGYNEKVSCNELWQMAPDNKLVGDLVFFTIETWDKNEDLCDPPEKFRSCYFSDPDVKISVDHVLSTSVYHGMAHDTREPENLASASIWLIPQKFDGTLIFPGSNGGILQLHDDMEEYTFRSPHSGLIFIVKQKDYHYDLSVENKAVSDSLLARKSDSDRMSVMRIEVKSGQRVQIRKVHKLKAHRKRHNIIVLDYNPDSNSFCPNSNLFWSSKSLKMNFYQCGWTTRGKNFGEMCDFCKAQREKEQKLHGNITICSPRNWLRESHENQWFPLLHPKKCADEFAENWNSIEDFSVVSSHGTAGERPNRMISPSLTLAKDTYSQTCDISLNILNMTDLDDLARYNIEISESGNEEQTWNKIITNFTINESDKYLSVTGSFDPKGDNFKLQVSISALGTGIFVAQDITISKCKVQIATDSLRNHIFTDKEKCIQ